IRESLDALGVAEEEWEEFFSTTLLALRGWGGMVRQIELRGDRVVHPVPAGSLIEFLAVRLILDRFALAATARDALGFQGPLSALRDAARARIEHQLLLYWTWGLDPPLRDAAHARIDHRWPPSVEQRAFAVFQLAQVLGLSPDVLYRLNPKQWGTILQ